MKLHVSSMIKNVESEHLDTITVVINNQCSEKTLVLPVSISKCLLTSDFFSAPSYCQQCVSPTISSSVYSKIMSSTILLSPESTGGYILSGNFNIIINTG